MSNPLRVLAFAVTQRAAVLAWLYDRADTRRAA